MSSVALSAGPIHLGMDTSKDKIAVGILRWEQQVPDVEVVFHDEASIRRLIARFDDPGGLRCCYEAGPTGFGLHRLLTSLGGQGIQPACAENRPTTRRNGHNRAQVPASR